MEGLSDNEAWVIRQLVRGPNNPYALSRLKSAPCSDQQVSNICAKLEGLQILKASDLKRQPKGPGRGRSYWLQTIVSDLLPTHADSSLIEDGIRILSKALMLQQIEPRPFPNSIIIAVLDHVITATKPYPLKGSVLENVRTVLTWYNQVLKNVERGHTLWMVPFQRLPPPLDDNLQRMIGEGPWEIEYAPNKTKPASRKEVEAWLKDRMKLTAST